MKCLMFVRLMLISLTTNEATENCLTYFITVQYTYIWWYNLEPLIFETYINNGC